ncbi:efflux RND transporter periplasmic adaptor subunit [uncultured Roseibium sp.]|uniref:efflux RND transporter periplasmic adaptor subunit n=1 Tax=uncultured Roseibium sp. TaxID=1936171 RepID=UPI002632ECB0|nr:efflux RND transporter periplasmic adaptor subunit [uncultured Roseibium sp.]
MRASLLLVFGFFVLIACSPQDADAPPKEPPIRGLLTLKIEESSESTERKYPGVLEPSEITSLSFEVGGKLGVVDLAVGQRVVTGELLAVLDDTQFIVSIENAEASVAEAEALLKQAQDDLGRQETLFERGVVSKVTVDDASTDVQTRRAQLVQAQKSLNSAEEDLEDTKIVAPFAGIINSVDADSFATVASGNVITSIYDATSYEVSFSVNFDVVAQLVVGTPATVRLADDPSVTLNTVVNEIGERADTVSSFPVIVELRETHPLIRAGMAVEVSFEFALPADQGFLIPITAAINEGQIPEDAGPGSVVPVPVYVFDSDTSTVKRREVIMAGIRENKLLIIEGLQPGERIAIAGVSFLREGMQVNLLEAGE